MAKAEKHRWVCPECGSGLLASSRPRRNATARYCLPCSAKSPTLVERRCEALEKKRKKKRTKLAKRAAKVRAAQREGWTVKGADLRAPLRHAVKHLGHLLSKVEFREEDMRRGEKRRWVRLHLTGVRGTHDVVASEVLEKVERSSISRQHAGKLAALVVLMRVWGHSSADFVPTDLSGLWPKAWPEIMTAHSSLALLKALGT
jgi:hypothetical protein